MTGRVEPWGVGEGHGGGYVNRWGKKKRAAAAEAIYVTSLFKIGQIIIGRLQRVANKSNKTLPEAIVQCARQQAAWVSGACHERAAGFSDCEKAGKYLMRIYGCENSKVSAVRVNLKKFKKKV
jgi:hypothetical protein